jgi:hypothetical protein
MPIMGRYHHFHVKCGEAKWLCHGVRENDRPSPYMMHVTRQNDNGFLNFFFFILICGAHLNGRSIS